MILSKPDIRAEFESGQLKINPPPEEKQWGEASIDLRLGFEFTTLKAAKGATFSVADGLEAIIASNFYSRTKLLEKDDRGRRQKFELEPNEFVLAQVFEEITIPPHLIGLVEGRSTYARVGLSMHQTAPWIQPGWTGHITLEIRNSGPLVIPLTPIIDKPCQITFFQLSTPLTKKDLYGAQDGGRFQNQKSALPSKT